jgi:hypothetical protein
MQVDTAQSLVQNGIYGTGNTLMTAANLAIEFRPHYDVKLVANMCFGMITLLLN